MKTIYEDNHLIVIEKPSGLLSQGEHSGDDNLVEILRKLWGRPYVGLVHRLDRNTSGLMVIAKRTKAANRLTQSLVSGDLKRKYLAWVKGKVQPQSGTMNDKLMRDEKTQKSFIHPEGKPSTLNYKVVREQLHGGDTARPITLLEITLETGRTHQIRAQLSARGHPLLGDMKYGGPSWAQRLALHSSHLSFPYPVANDSAPKSLSFDSPLPEDLDF